MSSQTDDALFESIVAGVLDRLRGGSWPPEASGGRRPAGGSSREPGVGSRERKDRRADAAGSPAGTIHLSDRVITASLLAEKLGGAKSVRFAPKAVLTPTARDYLRANWIEWGHQTKAAGDRKPPGGGSIAALVVRSTPAVERVLADLLPGGRTELLGCPDDAATLAISEIGRGGFAKAILFAEQAHRAACLANRHESVKAVAVRDASDAAAIKKQLRANVWCLDPTGRTYFELRNLVKVLTAE